MPKIPISYGCRFEENFPNIENNREGKIIERIVRTMIERIIIIDASKRIDVVQSEIGKLINLMVRN